MAGEDTDTEVLTRIGLSSVYTILIKSLPRWAGHIVRMPDHRLHKKILFGELQEGKRSRGTPKKSFKDKHLFKGLPLDIYHRP